MKKFKVSWLNGMPWFSYANVTSRDYIYDPYIQRVLMIGKLQITVMNN